MFKYSNGDNVEVGDIINVDNCRQATITELLSPSDPTWEQEFTDGAIAFTPNTLYEAPPWP